MFFNFIKHCLKTAPIPIVILQHTDTKIAFNNVVLNRQTGYLSGNFNNVNDT